MGVWGVPVVWWGGQLPQALVHKQKKVGHCGTCGTEFGESLTAFLNSHSETSSYFQALPSYPPATLGECQHPDPASQSAPVWEGLREKPARSSVWNRTVRPPQAGGLLC